MPDRRIRTTLTPRKDGWYTAHWANTWDERSGYQWKPVWKWRKPCV